MALKNRSQNTFAFFDFDGTITYFDTFGLFCLWTSPVRIVTRAPKLIASMTKYIQSKQNASKTKEDICVEIFWGMNKKIFQKKCVSFAKYIIPLLIKKTAIRKIQWHNKQGHQLAIVTRSPIHYIDPWATRAGNGFKKTIGTQLRMNKTNIIGTFATPNCGDFQKITAIYKTYPQLEQKNHKNIVYAYGDSSSDLPMLTLATDDNHRFYKRF